MRNTHWPTLTYWVRVTAVILGVLFVAYLVFRARGILLLTGLSFLLAVGLEPQVQWLQRYVKRRGYAVATVWSIIVLIGSSLVLAALLPALTQLSTLIEKLPSELSALSKSLSDQNSALGRFFARDDVQSAVDTALKKTPDALSNSLDTVLGFLNGVVSGVAAAFIVIALTIYFMLALPRILARADAILRTEQRVRVFHTALERIGGYIAGQFSISVCAGIVSFTFFLILGVPYAALVAIIVALTDAIPQIGATLGAIVGIAFALTLSFEAGIITLVFFVAYQLFENYILSPHIMSHAIELSPLVALLAVLIGGSVLGVVGAVIALPLTAAGLVIVRAYWRVTPEVSESPRL